MGILFLVVLVDMLGLTLVIPFLTYFVQDLASAEGIVDTGSRDFSAMMATVKGSGINLGFSDKKLKNKDKFMVQCIPVIQELKRRPA